MQVRNDIVSALSRWTRSQLEELRRWSSGNNSGDEYWRLNPDKRTYFRQYSKNRTVLKEPKSAKSEYNRDYFQQRKDSRKAYYRQYSVLNKDEIRDSKRKYYEKNSDAMKLYDKDYYRRTKDKRRDYDRGRYIESLDNPSAYTSRKESLKSWKTPELARHFFDSIGEKLYISQQSDWYRVSLSQVKDLGGRYLYSKFDSLGNALQYAYPEFDWDLSKFSHRGKKAEQRSLRSKIEELLPGIEVVEEHQHSDCALDGSQRPIEFDLWIPQHRIAIEYHGEHHYYNMDSAFGPNGTASLYSGRDLAKTEYCEKLGITLIAIPYWWDGGMESLSATLYQSRPDVFPMSQSRPIPSVFPVIGDRVRVSALDTFRE